MDTLYWMTGGSSTGAAAADKPTPPSMLGFAPAAADGLLFSNAGTTAGVQHPLIGALVGTDVPSTLQSQTAGSAVPAYSSTGAAMLRGMAGGYGVASSSGSILYATMPDSSRGSMGSGAYRRSHAYSSGVAGAQDANSSLGLSRSDFTLLGPAAAVAAQHGGSANHSVENLLEIVVALPHSTDAGVAVGPALAQLDSSALAALIKELGRTGHFQRSVELFDFVRRQAAPEYTHLLDIYTYTTAIAVCSSGQQLQRALDLMAEMRKRGVTCNVHTYSALMNVCIKCNEVALVQQVYAQMLQEGCAPNLVTYNTLIDLYVKTGQWGEAVRLLDKLEQEGIKPEVRTYNTIITACNKSGKPEQGLKVYQRMLAAGVRPSATTYTALISAYGKQGKVEAAMEMFADMVSRGCERNVITYSSLISACEKAGRLELALQLYEQMHKEGIAPNVVTFNSLIAACSHGGHWEQAKECFNQMLGQGCRPDGITYSALITSYQRGGRWREALQAFSAMPGSSCLPDSMVYNALLQVTWSSGVVSMQMRAMQIWSLANRNGHFRIYSQNKGDSSVQHHSCVTFTVGAAIVTLLRWLADVRHKATGDGGSSLRERVMFSLQKGKASRIEQPSAEICDAVTMLLQGHGSPFAVRLCDTTTQLEASSSELLQWLRSPSFAPLAHTVHAVSIKRLSMDALISEDSALETSCGDALSYVRTYEQLRGYAKQLSTSAQQHDPLGQGTRAQLLELALRYGTALRLQRETVYDAWELLQRLLMAGSTPSLMAGSTPSLGGGGSSGSGSGSVWRLMLVACLMITARQPAQEPLGSLPGYEMIALHTGCPVDAVMGAEQHVSLLLGSDAGAVSALRVCQVLQERLVGQHTDPVTAAALADDLAAAMSRVASSSELWRMQPSLLACGIMYCLRHRHGLVPLWPAALVQLTGIYDPTLGDIGLLLATLAPLLGVQMPGVDGSRSSSSNNNNVASSAVASSGAATEGDAAQIGAASPKADACTRASSAGGSSPTAALPPATTAAQPDTAAQQLPAAPSNDTASDLSPTVLPPAAPDAAPTLAVVAGAAVSGASDVPQP